MKKLYFLLAALLLVTAATAQTGNNIEMGNVGRVPPKHTITSLPAVALPQNHHAAHKETFGTTTYSDWYDLWDAMYDTGVTALYAYDVYPDSNLLDSTFMVYSTAYHIFTHGIGMSFDPSDSAYFYFALNPPYQVTAPYIRTQPYTLDSFWVPGKYMRYDPTSTIVDSLIIEFAVTQRLGTPPPDSGAYGLNATTPNAMYHPCTPDNQPRFGTLRYFRLQDECLDPVLTTTSWRRYAIPLTSADAFAFKINKFKLPVPITVNPGKYLCAYVYFKSQVAYPLTTNVYNANYYLLYAGEPRGANIWFPQSAHNTTTGYPGSYQDGLIATNQIRYNDAGFVFNGHNVLISSYAYANPSPDYSPGFDVPYMSFHITWTTPPIAITSNIAEDDIGINAYPNPANDELSITYTLQTTQNVSISLFDPMGRQVRNAGETGHSGKVTFNTGSLPAGVYYYELHVGGQKRQGKVTLTH